MSLAAEVELAPGDWQEEIWTLLGEISDPEIPILSLIDLGIVRYVRGASREVARVVAAYLETITESQAWRRRAGAPGR